MIRFLLKSCRHDSEFEAGSGVCLSKGGRMILYENSMETLVQQRCYVLVRYAIRHHWLLYLTRAHLSMYKLLSNNSRRLKGNKLYNFLSMLCVRFWSGAWRSVQTTWMWEEKENIDFYGSEHITGKFLTKKTHVVVVRSSSEQRATV